MTTEVAKSHRIQVDLPTEAFQHHPFDLGRLGRELRTLWLLDQVRQRRLGFSKAAELSDIPLTQFLDLMGQHQISPFDYDDEEIERELA